MPKYGLFREQENISRGKTKHHSKVMSFDSLFTSLDRFTFELPDIRYYVNYTMDISSIIALFYAISFHLKLEELFPPGFEFELEIPEISPYYPMPPEEFIQQPYVPPYIGTVVEKGIYGKSRFTACYYDPQFTVKHVFHTMLSAIVKRSYSQKLDEILEGVEINPHLARWFKWMETIAEAIVKNSMILGICLLGFSKFSKKAVINGEEYAVVPVTEKVTLYIRTLDQAMAGFILGISPLNVGRFAPPREPAVKPELRLIPYYRMRACLSRFMPHISAYKLVEKGVGAFEVHRSRRAHRYASARSVAVTVRRRVKTFLKGLVDNPFDLNSYLSSAVELALAYYSPHPYLRKYKSDLDVNVLKQHWISKWVKFGLQKEILEKIFELVKTTCLAEKRKQQLMTQLQT